MKRNEVVRFKSFSVQACPSPWFINPVALALDQPVDESCIPAPPVFFLRIVFANAAQDTQTEHGLYLHLRDSTANCAMSFEWPRDGAQLENRANAKNRLQTF
jgi:hypothetical protein